MTFEEMEGHAAKVVDALNGAGHEARYLKDAAEADSDLPITVVVGGAKLICHLGEQ